jgi:hypothetical protein
MAEAELPVQPGPQGPPAPPPAPLPLPETPVVTFPLVPILLAAFMTILAGVALSIAALIFYIWILYNSIIGWMIAYGLAKAPRDYNYTNAGVLALLTLFFSIGAYVVYHFANYQMFLMAGGAQGGPEPDFFNFVYMEAAEEHFIGGWQLGVVGTSVVWFIEMLITFFVAWGRIQNAIHMTKVESVPDSVRDYVFSLLNEGRSPEEIDRELSKYGWNLPEDQSRAIESAQALQALMEQAEAKKES